MNIHWPGTTIVKSQGNAFDWRVKTNSAVTQDKDWKQSATGTRNAVRYGDVTKSTSFTVYSKAKPRHTAQKEKNQ